MPPHATSQQPTSRDAPQQQGGRERSSSSRSATAMPAESGQPYRVGNYVVREEIGRGSFATVFRGEKMTTDPPTPVAIKAVIRSKLTTKLLENLESEIRLLRGIRQRNVVELLDCLKTQSHIYLVMAFCASGDLSQHIRKAASSKGKEGERYPAPKEGGLHEKVVRCFLGQLAEALKFLRDKDIIHRDIKPQNLLLHPASAEDIAAGHPEGIPLLQVADFGFARALPSTSLAETLCGSPLYMAPEILRYQKYDAKADLWSVGAVLYECCTGKPPFRAQNHVELLRRIERGQDRIKWPDDKRPEDGGVEVSNPRIIPDDIMELVGGLLRQNPVERMSFQDFFQKADEVARWGEGSLVAPGTIKQEEVQERGRRRCDYSQDDTGDAAQHPTPSERQEQVKPAQAVAPVLQEPLPPAPSTAAEQMPAFTRLPLQCIQVTSSPGTPNLDAAAPGPASGSSSTGEPAQPPILQQRKSFAPRYVVGGTEDREKVVQIKTKDFAVVTTAATPTAAAAEQVSAQGSRQVSRKNSTADTRDATSRVYSPPTELPKKSGISLGLPSALASSRQTQQLRPQQQDLALSGMTGDDDSVLGREYVVVEKRNVEVNALADEMAAQPRRSSTLSRRNSRGFLSRQLSHTPSSPVAMANAAVGVSPSPPSPALPYPPSYSYGKAVAGASYDPPPFARAQTQTYGSSPRSRTNTALTNQTYGSSPGRYGGLAAGPPTATASAALAIVGSGSTAIAKALSMASLKLFGSPTQNIWLRKGSHRRPIERTHFDNALLTSEEERLLSNLEDIAQKATVIFDFADSKLIMLTSMMAAGDSKSGSLGGMQASLSSPFFSNAQPHPRRTSSSSSDRGAVSSLVAPAPASTSPAISQQPSPSAMKPPNSGSLKPELLPGETLVLYLKALAFLQAGIEAARLYWSNKPQNQGSSADLNDYVQWFRSRFNECFEKAEWAKGRLAGDIPDSAMLAEKLIYERALEMSRAAAVSELLNENPSECEIAYDTALWMLYAILDESMQEGEQVGEEDKVHVQKFVTSIKGRLEALKRKIRAAK